MDDFSWFDSLNTTGQWQPSSLPDISDSMLNNQILDGIVLNPDDISSLLAHNHDDISNALVDSPNDPFDTLILESHISQSSFENDDDLIRLLSSPIPESPKHSIIEDTLERMNLNQSQTDIFSSQISVQVGSSPVEPKENENIIRANRIVGQQKRILKGASKSRKSSVYHSGLSTVGPIDFLSTYSECQPCTTVEMQNDFAFQQQLLESGTMESKQIQIKSQPRPKFRPRTQNESKNASHYIRCEDNREHEYPTIFTSYSWTLNPNGKPVKNIIEVTLTDNKQQPHLYAIDNKNSQALYDDNTLIFRLGDQPTNSLYFRVTDEDLKVGFKSFMIEYIKSKQDDNITKDVIKTRQLEQSMLRFTRYCQIDNGSYQPDVTSIGYSCIMSEAYGDVAVEHMGPRYGPIGGDENVYILLKGRILKDDLTIDINEEITSSCRRVTYTKNGNMVYFSMPAFSNSECTSATASIIIYYKEEEIHRSAYLYKSSLDEELANLNINDSATNLIAPSTSNYFSAMDFFSATGACPVSSSSRKSSTTKPTKRLHNK